MEKVRVFYLDDEPALLDVTKAFLEAEGDIIVDTEESSTVAMRRLDESSYDVLVSDYQIPEMDGIALLKKLRERGDLIPFILFTGRGREDVAMEALNNGANFYLQKGGDPTVQFGELRHAVIQLTERSRMEGRLVESERRLSALMENLPGMAYRCRNDQDWTMEFVSEGCRELTGYAPADLMGNRTVSYASLILPEHAAMVRSEVQSALKDGSPYRMTYAIKVANKATKWVWERGGAVLDADGRTVALEGFITDITEQKMAEEKLRQVNLRLNLMTSTTRHDIMNQLLTIGGYMDLLKAKIENPEQLRYANMMERSLRSIHAYINFTKDYEAVGSTTPSWQGVDRTVSSLHIAKDDGRIIMTDRVRGLEVLADPMLPRVFHNLIEDSRRYGGRPVTIKLDCREVDGRLVLIYEDDGVGIPEDEKEHIFEKGFGKGTGLGLFLARNILNITGMTIAETGLPGVGARFEIYIPYGQYRFV